MTSRVARAAELIGRPVVTLDTATIVAELRDVLFDPQRSCIVGFTLRGRGLLSSPLVGILPADWVQSIGRDAVMIQSETSIVRDREGMEAAIGDQEEIIGKEVVTDGGASLGNVRDIVVEIEGPSARVVGLELDRPGGHQWIVPVTDAVPISGDALVLPAEVERDAVIGMSGFRESLERRRDRPPSEVGA